MALGIFFPTNNIGKALNAEQTGKAKHLQTDPRSTKHACASTPASNRVPSPLVLLRGEVARLQEEVHLLRQMKEMLTKDLEESQGGKSPEVLTATELRVQLAQKEQELARAREALQGEWRAGGGSLPSLAWLRLGPQGMPQGEWHGHGGAPSAQTPSRGCPIPSGVELCLSQGHSLLPCGHMFSITASHRVAPSEV